MKSDMAWSLVNDENSTTMAQSISKQWIQLDKNDVPGKLRIIRSDNHSVAE